MNLQKLSDSCRTPKARDVLSMALEVSTAYDERKRPVIEEVVEEVVEIVDFAVGRRDERLQRERIRDAVERFMLDGKYSPLKGLVPRVQERGSYSQQNGASIDNLFCTGQ